MKLRKALVASAAAVAVSFSGVSVAQAQSSNDTNATAAVNTGTQDQTTDNGSGSDSSSSSSTSDPNSFWSSSDEEGKTDPKKIANFLSIMTAVIGLFSTIMSGEDLGVTDLTKILNIVGSIL